jgi:hypothetical protein
LEKQSTWKFVPKSADQFAIPNTTQILMEVGYHSFWRRKTKSNNIMYLYNYTIA